MLHSDSFGPLIFNDLQATFKSGQTPSWAIQVSRFGFEPRVKKFSFTPIQRNRLTALEMIKQTYEDKK